MPTYEYACRDCGEHVEVVQSFRDDPLTTCGVCGGDLRKVFSAAGIIFKGSGYYVTDTRKGSGGSGPSKDGAKGEPSKKTGESSSGSSDSGSSGSSGSSGGSGGTSGSSDSGSSSATKKESA